MSSRKHRAESLETRLVLRREIAEGILGPIRWEDQVTGYALCPGACTHSSETTDEVRVKIDGAPTIACFHSSCSELVAEANFRLRSQIGTAEVCLEPVEPGFKGGASLERLRAQRRARVARLEGELETALQQPVDPAELLRLSPTQITWREEDDWKHLIRLFHPNDTIWMGEITDSRPACFKQISDWLGWKRPPGTRICPSTFPYRCRARTKGNVLFRRFLVVESDELAPAEQAGLLLHLAKTWPLAAVVYSGRRSLHGWFRWIPTWDDQKALPLRRLLTALNCDPSAADAQQPFRLPGSIRPEQERWQSLLYLDPAHGYNDHD